MPLPQPLNVTRHARADLNVYGVRVKITAEPPVITELQRYFGAVSADASPVQDLTLRFNVDHQDVESDEIKRDASAVEHTRGLYELELGPDSFVYVIPDNGYPAAIVSRVLTTAVSKRLPGHGIIPIHAGGVSRGDDAVLLVGHGGSGKSTLSFTLARTGYSFLSDETALVDTVTKEVLPYFSGVFLRAQTMDMFPGVKETSLAHAFYDYADEETRWCIALSEMAGVELSPRRRLKSILFPRYEPTRPFSTARLSRSQTIVHLMQNLKYVPPTNAIGIVHHLDELLDGVDVYRVFYPDSGAIRAFIGDLVGGGRHGPSKGA